MVNLIFIKEFTKLVILMDDFMGIFSICILVKIF